VGAGDRARALAADDAEASCSCRVTVDVILTSKNSRTSRVTAAVIAMSRGQDVLLRDKAAIYR